MKLLSLGLVRGLIAGVVGLLAGMAVTMAVRAALGYPAWSAAPVSAAGAIVGMLTFLWGAGAFTDWWSWARGAEGRALRRMMPAPPLRQGGSHSRTGTPPGWPPPDRGSPPAASCPRFPE